jgi:membrane protease YdiL (CAAX protease family)
MHTVETPARTRPFPLWPSLAAIVGSAVVLVVAIGIGILILQATGHIKDSGTGDVADSLTGIFAYVALAAFIAFVWPRLAHEPLSALLHAPTRSDLIVAAIGLAATVAFDLATTLVLVLLHKHHVQAGFTNFNPHGAAALVTAGFVIIAIGPLAEELLFRGLILNTLALRMPFVLAALVTSVLFAGAHGDPVLFPSLVAGALVWAYAYRRTRNLSVTILIHACANAVGYFMP